MRRALTCIALLASLVPVGSQAALEDQVKAAFLLNFAKFIQWTATSFSNVTDTLRLCVAGSDDTVQTIRSSLAGKRVGRHPIEVHSGATDTAGCHMAYLQGDAGVVKDLIAALESGGTLSVYETDTLLEGGVIRFYLENRKVRFEVNLDAARSQGLVISSKLLAVARIASTDD